jgi:putative endonuclease
MAKPSNPPAPARVAAFRTGLSAETSAADYLEREGYRILARRFKTRCGEIDIVAQRRGLVAFVEVKARARLDDAAYAVTPRQRSRIVAAAEAWLMGHPDHADNELRFDAILIAPNSPPQHLPGAFDATP